MKEPTTDNSYDQVIAHVFRRRWTEGATEVFFSKDDLIDAAHELKLRIKNVADILYTFRSRRGLPAELAALGQWVISSHGSGRYAFTALSGQTLVEVPISLKCYPIPYAVPEIVAANLAEDEQGLLTIVRYNRILDVFTGLACFHLQSHVRTQVKGHGQVEIDDLYVGIDKDGRGFVLPVEAKDAGESLGVDKAVALTLFAQAKYQELICRPIAIIREGPEQFACVEFEPATSLAKVAVLEMRRYRLVRETDS